ncbi:MAG: hypothetical protein WBY67_19635, partial [Pseudolabrys sp.]
MPDVGAPTIYSQYKIERSRQLSRLETNCVLEFQGSGAVELTKVESRRSSSWLRASVPELAILRRRAIINRAII